MTPARLRWGLILISLGVLIILCNAGHLDWDYWYELGTWWPVLLIAIGIEKIFLNSKLRIISYLSPLLLIGTMTVVAFNYTGTDFRSDSFFDSSRWSWESSQKVERMVVGITHNRHDLLVNPTSSVLASGRFGMFSRKPRVDNDIVDGVAKLELFTRSRSNRRVVIAGRDVGRDWRVRLSNDIPMELTCKGDRSDVDLNLHSMKIEKLFVTNDDGDISVKIGKSSPICVIEIEGDECDFRFRYPKIAGVKVDASEYDSFLDELGFTKTDDFYFSPNYDSSTVKIDLKIADNLRHLLFDDY